MDKTNLDLADDLTSAFQKVTDGTPLSVDYEPFQGAAYNGAEGDLGMVLDLPLTMSVELGRVKLPIGKLLSINPGDVWALDVKAGDPLNIMINGCLVARGDIVVFNKKYGLRLTHIITPSERLKNFIN